MNKKYIGFCKTMFNFKNAILETIDLYSMHNTYQERKLSISRALEHYVKINDSFDLIKFKDLKNIKNLYKEFLLKNKISNNCKSSYDSINERSFYSKKEVFDIETEEKEENES